MLTPIAIAVLALSMSADAFAASIGRGAAHRPSFPQAIRGALVFGGIEAVTPLVGWALGLAAASYVAAVDHWIAFGLLLIVGGKMIWEALTRGDGEDEAPRGGGAAALVMTAIGTSIDAAAVGVTLAFLGADILVIAAAIGCATFVMTTIGMMIGRAVGARLGSVVEVLGGVALIVLGAVILSEHLRGLA